jgi:hypothetical protein
MEQPREDKRGWALRPVRLGTFLLFFVRPQRVRRLVEARRAHQCLQGGHVLYDGEQSRTDSVGEGKDVKMSDGRLALLERLQEYP